MTIDEFLVELATIGGWRYNRPLRIPSDPDKGTPLACPISAVIQKRIGKSDDMESFVNAREKGVKILGLSEEDARAIMSAADGYSEHDASLRKRLLVACGLKKEL